MNVTMMWHVRGFSQRLHSFLLTGAHLRDFEIIGCRPTTSTF